MSVNVSKNFEGRNTSLSNFDDFQRIISFGFEYPIEDVLYNVDNIKKEQRIRNGNIHPDYSNAFYRNNRIQSAFLGYYETGYNVNDYFKYLLCDSNYSIVTPRVSKEYKTLTPVCYTGDYKAGGRYSEWRRNFFGDTPITDDYHFGTREFSDENGFLVQMTQAIDEHSENELAEFKGMTKIIGYLKDGNGGIYLIWSDACTYDAKHTPQTKIYAVHYNAEQLSNANMDIKNDIEKRIRVSGRFNNQSEFIDEIIHKIRSKDNIELENYASVDVSDAFRAFDILSLGMVKSVTDINEFEQLFANGKKFERPPKEYSIENWQVAITVGELKKLLENIDSKLSGHAIEGEIHLENCTLQDLKELMENIDSKFHDHTISGRINVRKRKK